MTVVYMGIFSAKAVVCKGRIIPFLFDIAGEYVLLFLTCNSISHSIFFDLLTFALNKPESLFVSKLVWITKQLGLWRDAL